jgi:hypothetical protein
MGYNGHIYNKGEYVDLDSPGEAKRLLGYPNILVKPLSVAVKADVEPKEVKKTAGTSVAKTKKGSGKK